jgi:hypothetical protein
MYVCKVRIYFKCSYLSPRSRDSQKRVSWLTPFRIMLHQLVSRVYSAVRTVQQAIGFYTELVWTVGA